MSPEELQPENAARSDQEQLKEMQTRARGLAAPLVDVGKRSFKDPDLLAALEKAASKLQDAGAIAASLTALRDDIRTFAKSVRESRAAGFGRVLAEFVQAQRAAGTEVREISTTVWRVGPIELEGDAAASRARARYAHREIDEWRPVASRSDLDSVLSEALARLERVEIDEAQLGAVFFEAYGVLALGGLESQGAARRVKLVELRREVHLAVLRRVLAKDADRPLGKVEFPSWAFAYNADRYRRIHRELPAQQRLSFETGSQQDHKVGLAVTMNGLDPKAEYKAFCYAEPTPAGDGQ